MSAISTVIFSACLFVTFLQINGQCNIDVRVDLQDKSPLIFNQSGFIYPSTKSTKLTFLRDESFTLSCAKNNVLKINEIKTSNSVSVKCEYGKKFITSDKRSVVFDIRHALCDDPPKSELLMESSELPKFPSCKRSGYFHIKSGFTVAPNKFLYVFGICFDQLNRRPVVSFNKIDPNNAFKQWKQQQPIFSNTLYHNDVGFAYTKIHQTALFGKLFGFHQKFITDDQYLERGHLAARADFFYNNEQNATYYYANVVPTWKTVNYGNWLNVEESVRKLAVRKNQVLEIWTGSFGELELSNIHNHMTKIKLRNTHPKADQRFAVTVPKYLFKLVYEPETKHAVVLVVINNPYWNRNPKDILCSDVSHSLKWLNVENVNPQRGHLYACKYEDFLRSFRVLPNLTVKGVLTSS